MRRSMAVAMIAVLAMTVPMADGAGSAKRYRGSFEPGGTLKFKVKRINGNRKVIDFTFRAFPIACASGAQTTTGFLSFILPINERNRFRANGIRGDAAAPKARLRLRGKLVGARRARGTMRIDGSRVPIDAGGRDDCESGPTNWTARRT